MITVISSSPDNMSSPVPISTDEISQYQIETALDNFSNLKTKVGEAVRAFLASVKFDTAKITNETLTRFLETHLENLNILFTEELFSDPEFFKKLASSDSSDKQSTSTNTLDVNTLSNAIVKEILPSIYENNVQLSTSAAQRSSKPAVPTSNITESTSSTQIPSKNVTAISPQTSITSIHRISYVSQMRAESSVLLGALAITLDKLQGITTTISRQAVVSTTVATAAPLMLSKKTPSIFKPKHKDLKLNIFSKASILKVISPIGKMFTFLIKGSLKLLVGTVKLIGKSIVYVSKLIFNLAKTILDVGKRVFKKIGQGLAGLFKLVKKAFVFSAKRIGKIFKAVFIDSKIALVVLPYALGCIYGYIKTKFFSEGTFIDGLKKMLASIVPTLPKFGKKEKDKDADKKDGDSSFLDFVGNAVKDAAKAIYNKLNSPLTSGDVDKVEKIVETIKLNTDKSSPVPVPIQITFSIIDWVLKQVGIELNLQEKSIHYTNVLGVLFFGKEKYTNILAETEKKREKNFKKIDNNISEFEKNNLGKGKLDILNESVIQPMISYIKDMFVIITDKMLAGSNKLITTLESIKKAVEDWSLNDFETLLKELTDPVVENTLNILEQIITIFAIKSTAAAGNAIFGLIGLVGGPIGAGVATVGKILSPLLGMSLGQHISDELRNAVGRIPDLSTGVRENEKLFANKISVSQDLVNSYELPASIFGKSSTATDTSSDRTVPVPSLDTVLNQGTLETPPTGSSIIPPLSETNVLPFSKKKKNKKTDISPKNFVGPPLTEQTSKSDQDKRKENAGQKLVSNPLLTVKALKTYINDLAKKDITGKGNDTVLNKSNIKTIFERAISYPKHKPKLAAESLDITETEKTWVDVGRFKIMRAQFFNNYVAHYLTSKADNAKITENDYLFLKYLYRNINSPSGKIYTGFSNKAADILVEKLGGPFLTLLQNNIDDNAPYKNALKNRKGLDASLPLALAFTKIDDKRRVTIFDRIKDISKELANSLNEGSSIANQYVTTETVIKHQTQFDKLRNKNENFIKDLNKYFNNADSQEIKDYATLNQQADEEIKKIPGLLTDVAKNKESDNSASVTAVGVVNTPDAPVTNNQEITNTNFGGTN